MVQLAPLLLLVPLAPQGDPLPVASRVKEVTVYPGTARVTRTADLPAGGGRFAIEGLPWSMDPATVRVRCYGADVVGFETRERQQASVPDAGVEELRQRAAGLQRELEALEDEASLLALVAQHLERLLKMEERAHADELAGGEIRPEVWRENLEFLTGQLRSNRDRQRETRWKIEDASRRLKDARLDLGRIESSGGVYLRDVIVEVVSSTARGSALDLEYTVSSAGWQPIYDLRTAQEARSVELSYRAQVWQQSGEDWREVELSLSTARPHLGAQGPDPEPVWLRLQQPGAGLRFQGIEAADGLLSAEAAEEEAAADAPFAAVQSQGLSVRFRLAARDTVASRRQPTTVLIGQRRLAVEPEYQALPARDANVWLRGRTVNGTDWVLLPGRAAVYFGADFIGFAEIGTVQPGEDLVLHLGPDPALKVERIQVEDLLKPPGVFGSRSTRTETWRIHLANHGAAAARPDGSALVFVREVLPRSTDERIKVELLRTEPETSAEERWRKDREEKGILTWAVVVPRGGEAGVYYQTRISFPEGARVVR